MPVTSTFPTNFVRWMTTASSAIGVAVATPAVAGALSGAVSWRQAALPLIGAAVAVFIPERTGAFVTAQAPARAALSDVGKSIQDLTAFVSAVRAVGAAFTSTAPTERAVVAPTQAAPAQIADAADPTLEAAYADYQRAAALLRQLQAPVSQPATSVLSPLSPLPPRAAPAPVPAPVQP